MPPTITGIENFEFTYEMEDVGTDGHGFNLVYEPGSTVERALFAVRIHTDAGITGEYVGGNSPVMPASVCILTAKRARSTVDPGS